MFLYTYVINNINCFGHDSFFKLLLFFNYAHFNLFTGMALASWILLKSQTIFWKENGPRETQ